MAKIPDGTFKNWQDNEIIHASEYVQEREMLRIAANDNSDRLDELETVTNALGLDSVQLSKITNDTGGVKLNITDTFKNLLDEIVKLGQGMHTFYAVSGTKGLPPTNISTRGIAHFTSATIGWVYATDYKNNIFTNYYDTNKWLGWNQLATTPAEGELWSGGTTGKYMMAGQTAVPTKKLSECQNGWILVWSDFDDATNKANNYDFHYSYIPKFIVTKHNASGHLFSIPYTPSGVTVKNINVADGVLTGVAGNETPNTAGDVVLRYVLEW